MNKYKDFYEKIIGFDKFIEVRCFCPSGAIFSKYFYNWDNLEDFIKNNRSKLNLYSGVNPRKEEGRKSESVSKIKNLIFDLEAIGEKPILSENNQDTKYFLKLKNTVNFIQEYISKNYNLDISAIVVSGRGLHLYVTINEEIIDALSYKDKYKQFYKDVCDYINKDNPYKGEIKVDSMCSDFVRILGLPGSINIKYPEKPIRKLIYLNLNTSNKIKYILDTYNKYNKISNKMIILRKYNEKTIFNSPEYKIFEFNPRVGTLINNKLRFALKLLMIKNNCSNFQEVAYRISNLGFPYKEMDFVEESCRNYKYSESILNNYVLENFNWAVEVGFKVPYMLKEEKAIKEYIKYIKECEYIFIDNNIKEIKNFNDFKEVISKFNKEYNDTDNYLILYTKALEKNIFNNIKDDILNKFIVDNDLFNRLKYYFEKD